MSIHCGRGVSGLLASVTAAGLVTAGALVLAVPAHAMAAVTVTVGETSILTWVVVAPDFTSLIVPG